MPSGGTLYLSNNVVLAVPPGYAEDLVYINNQPYPIDGTDQVLQQIRKNLKTFQGEWFLDATFGTPWTQQILIKNPVGADAAIKAVIAGTDGVLALTAFNYSFNSVTGMATVSFSVQSQFGPLSGVAEVLG
jgi:hypothetical protein